MCVCLNTIAYSIAMSGWRVGTVKRGEREIFNTEQQTHEMHVHPQTC